jgi:hypothetical protein
MDVLAGRGVDVAFVEVNTLMKDQAEIDLLGCGIGGAEIDLLREQWPLSSQGQSRSLRIAPQSMRHSEVSGIVEVGASAGDFTGQRFLFCQLSQQRLNTWRLIEIGTTRTERTHIC